MENEVLDNELEKKKDPINDAELAGFWTRVLAALVDGLVLLPFAILEIVNLMYIKNLPFQLVISIAMILYKPLMEYRYGATLGKMALKIKVVSTDFNMITLNQSFIRFTPWFVTRAVEAFGFVLLFSSGEFADMKNIFEMAELLSTMTPELLSNISSIFLMASVFVVAISPRKQGIHDLMAGTYCVYR